MQPFSFIFILIGRSENGRCVIFLCFVEQHETLIENL